MYLSLCWCNQDFCSITKVEGTWENQCYFSTVFQGFQLHCIFSLSAQSWKPLQKKDWRPQLMVQLLHKIGPPQRVWIFYNIISNFPCSCGFLTKHFSLHRSWQPRGQHVWQNSDSWGSQPDAGSLCFRRTHSAVDHIGLPLPHHPPRKQDPISGSEWQKCTSSRFPVNPHFQHHPQSRAGFHKMLLLQLEQDTLWKSHPIASPPENCRKGPRITHCHPHPHRHPAVPKAPHLLANVPMGGWSRQHCTHVLCAEPRGAHCFSIQLLKTQV